MPFYYVSRKSPVTGKSCSAEVDVRDFPAGLQSQRPDFSDQLSTKLCGYAMERIGLRFQTHISSGGLVYSVISDDWRVTSWLATP